MEKMLRHGKLLSRFIGLMLRPIFVINLSLPCLTVACTGIYLKNNRGYIFARSFDWPRNQGMAFVNKRNVAKTAMTSFLGESNSIQWTSRYGSVTICQVG